MTGATYATLIALDAKLSARAAVPRLGLFACGVLREFYEHPTARELVLDWGRGSGKSTVLYKVAMNETLFGAHEVTPGERHWAFVSSRAKDEGAKGIGVLSSWHTFVGVRHNATVDTIELLDMPRGYRVSASSVGGNSGWRAYFDGSDEVGKWPSDGALGVDAREVLASKRAMTISHPEARRVIASTPLLVGSPFHELVAAGSNERQIVSVAPTWIATDGRITEEQTRRLEPNERVHAREYGAQFATEWEHGYFAGLIDPCVAPWSAQVADRGSGYVIAIDQAFSRDLFAIAVAHAELDRVVIDRVEAIVPPRGGSLSPTECLRRVRGVRDDYRAGSVACDQFAAAPLTDLAAREGLHLESIPWTATSKAERFEQVRVMMRDRRLVIPNDAPLVRELSGIGTRLHSSGHESIQARPGFTDDRVAALVLAVTRAAAGCSPGEMARVRRAMERITSPYRFGGGRGYG